jgi:hypothetical protein
MEKTTPVGLHRDCCLANASERGEHFCGGNLRIIKVSTSCVTGATDETEFAFSELANGVLLALLLSRAARPLAFAGGTSLDLGVGEFLVFRILIFIRIALKLLTMLGVGDIGRVEFGGGNCATA